MDVHSLPKPHSLRLNRDLDNRVRAFARTLSGPGQSSRVPLNRALIALLEAGLNSLQVAPSPKNGMLQVLQELDPEWSGNRLRDLEPLPVATRSGKSPVQMLLERRG